MDPEEIEIFCYNVLNEQPGKIRKKYKLKILSPIEDETHTNIKLPENSIEEMIRATCADIENSKILKVDTPEVYDPLSII